MLFCPIRDEKALPSAKMRILRGEILNSNEKSRKSYDHGISYSRRVEENRKVRRKVSKQKEENSKNKDN